METLALRYRPRRFTDLVGQPEAQLMLRQMVIKSRVPHALLFDGSRGTGKTTTARILAAALNCEHPELDHHPCGECGSCTDVFDGSSLDVLEIDAASNGLVDDVRGLRKTLAIAQSGRYRVVILDEAHSMSAQAFNALLKTLEEPPEGVLFILCTTEPHKIPATITSRCVPFTYRRLSAANIAARLAAIAVKEGKPVEPALLALLAEKADGAMRDGIMLLDKVTAVGMTTAEQYQRLIGHHDAAFDIINALRTHNRAAAHDAKNEALTRVASAKTVISDLIGLLRDVLHLRDGGEIEKTGKALADRQNLALALDTRVVVACLKHLWDLKLLRADDDRDLLDLALVMLGETLAAASPAPQRMTLSQMSQR